MSHKRNIRLAALGLALGSALIAEGAAAADRALLIGIDRYRTASLNLVGSENDVSDMRALLTGSFGYEANSIKTLLHEQATRQGILNAIEDWLVKGTKPGDRVTLFYSGHGYRVADKNNDDGDGLDETLVPHDVSIEASNINNLIIDDEIGTLLNRMRDRKVMVVIDSCFSGTLTRGELLQEPPPKAKNGANIVKSLAVVLGQSSLPEGHRGLVRKELPVKGEVTERAGGFIERRDDVIAWSAVSATQLALVDTDSERPGGVFTKRFMMGLRDKRADASGDGRVTNQELLDFVRRESNAFCDKHKADCKDGLSPLLEATSDTAVADVVTNARPATVQETAAESFGEAKAEELVLTIEPRNTFRIGDTMSFSVRSDYNGYLIVLDINAKGEVTQLFPNKFSEKAGDRFEIQAGRPIRIPHALAGFQFKAGEPTGDGVLYAILSKDPLRVDDLLDTTRGFEVVADGRSFVERLAQRLREIVGRPDSCQPTSENDECKDTPIRWWATTAEYRIEP